MTTTERKYICLRTYIYIYTFIVNNNNGKQLVSFQILPCRVSELKRKTVDDNWLQT